MCQCIIGVVVFALFFLCLFGDCFHRDNTKEEFKGDFKNTLAERVRTLLRDESTNWKYYRTVCGEVVQFKKRTANLSFWPRLEVSRNNNGGLNITIDDGGEYGGSVVARVNDEECMELYLKFCQHGKAVDENNILNKL